jgi:hypothetical protein
MKNHEKTINIAIPASLSVLQEQSIAITAMFVFMAMIIIAHGSVNALELTICVTLEFFSYL